MTRTSNAALCRSALCLGVATFAALGITALPAHAQLLLNSGDAITVSGAGTVGIINSLPVITGQSSYTNGTVGLNAFAVETTGTATFALAAGGSLSGTDSQPGTGNTGYGLIADGSGTTTITSGAITGGQFNGGLLAEGTGPVLITGGTITSGQFGNAALIAQGTEVVTVTGGIINKGAGGSLGLSSGLEAGFGGTIDLFSQGGLPFLIDGVSMNNKSLQGFTSATDTIVGTLLNGDQLNTTFEAFDAGTINLNVGSPPATPEPASFAALALGTLCIGMRPRNRSGK